MTIYSMDRDSLQGLVNSVAQYRPNVGRLVRVVDARHKKAPKAHAGKIGRVTWHGRDQFNRRGCYMDEAAHLMCDARGTSGYRVRVEPLDGGAPFFVSAELVMVCLD